MLDSSITIIPQYDKDTFQLPESITVVIEDNDFWSPWFSSLIVKHRWAPSKTLLRNHVVKLWRVKETKWLKTSTGFTQMEMAIRQSWLNVKLRYFWKVYRHWIADVLTRCLKDCLGTLFLLPIIFKPKMQKKTACRKLTWLCTRDKLSIFARYARQVILQKQLQLPVNVKLWSHMPYRGEKWKS